MNEVLVRKVREDMIIGEKVMECAYEIYKNGPSSKSVMTDIMDLDIYILDKIDFDRRL
jgi:hypothetical protein